MKERLVGSWQTSVGGTVAGLSLYTGLVGVRAPATPGEFAVFGLAAVVLVAGLFLKTPGAA